MISGKEERVKYLIIGNSAGAIGAAEAIREVDRAGSVLIVSDEPYPAYSRPLISEHLATGQPLEKILFRPSDFYRENGIATRLGCQVKNLDTGKHLALTGNGETIVWEKLLLATGGRPIVPPIKGIKSQGVFTFTNLDDAGAISRHISRETKTVVIGGGLIGVSVTEALLKRGIPVTIVEMKERLLSIMLDETASNLAEESLKKAGGDVLTGHTVLGISSNLINRRVNGVKLDDGSSIPCQVVIVAIGVSPRTELATQAGLKIGQGIVVDRHMATSCPDIYACGDVAEAYDFIHGCNRLTPIWPNAYLGGRTAGFNMAGVNAEYPGGTAMNAMKYFGVDIISAGIVVPPDNDGYEIISNNCPEGYRKFVLREDYLVGMVMVGNIDRAGIIYNLMKNRVKVTGFKDELLSPDFGLASLPDDLWRPEFEVPAIKPGSQVAPVETEETLVING